MGAIKTARILAVRWVDVLVVHLELTGALVCSRRILIQASTFTARVPRKALMTVRRPRKTDLSNYPITTTAVYSARGVVGTNRQHPSGTDRHACTKNPCIDTVTVTVEANMHG